MSTMLKRMLSLAVALIMVVCLIPWNAITVRAAEADTSWHEASAGTAADPFILDSAEDLLGLVELSKNKMFSGQTFQLAADIDLTGIAWSPIGQHAGNTSAQVFDGIFDGNGHTIKNLTAVFTGKEGYFGLFGKVSGTIKNLNITGFDYSGKTGYSYHCGAVAGLLTNGGSLENVHATAAINVSTRYIGGLVGGVEGSDYDFSITNCSFSGSVHGRKEVGGLVGYVKVGTRLTITNCTNNGTISTTESTSYTGGLIGHLQKATATITDSHNNGLVSCAVADTLVGTIIGGITGDSSKLGSATFKNVSNKKAQSVADAPAYNIPSSSTSYVTVTGEVACGHDYVDGVCSMCGQEEPVNITTFDFMGTNMALNNSLAMNFAFSAEHYDDWTGFYAEIVKEYADREAVTTTVPVSNWERRGTYYVVTYNGVAAKEMTDNFQITVYNPQGEAVSVTRTDSVRAYARRTLDNPNSSDAVKTVIVNMLNYGAAAQNYFTYNTGDLANNGLTADEQDLALDNISVSDQRIAGDNFDGSKLTLESNIQLSLIFKDVTADMYAKAVYTDAKSIAHTVDCNIELLEGYGIVSVNTLAVADYSSLVEVTVYNADTTVYGSASDSVASYVARNNVSTSDDVTAELKALGDALVKFAESARKYFVN